MSVQDRHRLQRLLSEFDQRWQSGPPPRMGDILNQQQNTDERPELLRELIQIDQEYRWRRFKSPAKDDGIDPSLPRFPLLEDYRRAYPELGIIPVELLATEYLIRRRWGDAPSPAEYLGRFPEQAPELDAALRAVDAELREEFAGGSRTDQLSKADAPASEARSARRAAAEVTPCYAAGPSSGNGPPLRQVGRYRLGQRLGAGAFGSVWRAWDSELKRAVAIKLPHSGRFLAPGEAERFLREARAAAGLHHEGIVPVHDAGRQDDILFIVTELVPGESLGEWLEQHRLNGRDAAELVARVADALDYAHRHGVVHRDLKPSNILLQRSEEAVAPFAAPPLPTPRIADFGLAKRDEQETTMTGDGDLLGTPAYMSPEQVRNPHDADARSDIYSLGVILYRILTGELPFTGMAPMVLEQVRHDEPRPPRRLDGRIPVDLETICLKCLRKEPNARYATAAALADDLRRWLRGEPIIARPLGRLARALRWARRQPVVAGLSTAVFLLLLVLTVGSMLAVVHITRQKDAAEEMAEKYRQEKQNAEAALRETAQAQCAVVSTLDDMHIAAKTREKRLRASLESLERIAADNERVEIRESLYRAHRALGELLSATGRTAEATQEYERSLAIVTEMARDEESPGPYQQGQGILCYRLAESALSRGDRPAARKYAAQAGEVIRAFLKANPEHMGARRAHALTSLLLADIAFDAGDRAESGTQARQALMSLETLNHEAPGFFRRDLARAYRTCGRAIGDLRQMEDLFIRASQELREERRVSPFTPQLELELAEVHTALSTICRQQRHWKQAEEYAQQAVGGMEILLRADADNSVMLIRSGLVLMEMAQVRLQSGDAEGARTWSNRALAVLKKLAQQDQANALLQRHLAGSYEQIGVIDVLLGADAAVEHLEETRRRREVALAADPKNRLLLAELAQTCARLGTAHLRKNRFAEAQVYLEKSVRLVRGEGDRPLPGTDVAWLRKVEADIDVCKGATRALADLEFARGQPLGVGRDLLAIRAIDFARRGRVKEATETAEELAKLSPLDYSQDGNLACCFALLGGPGVQEPTLEQKQFRVRALAHLRRAVEMGYDLAEICTDPDLASLRQESEYRNIVERLKSGAPRPVQKHDGK